MLPTIGLLSKPMGKWVYGLAGCALAAGLSFGVGYWRGGVACERDQQADLAEHLQRGIEQATQIAREDAAISERYEVERIRYITQFQTRVDEVTREIEPDCMRCGIKLDGLRALNALRFGGAYATDTGQPHGGVPAPSPHHDGVVPRSGRGIGAGQPHLLRLRLETQIPGRGGEAERGDS